jgi:exodeoxyribonuclease VII large subunit
LRTATDRLVHLDDKVRLLDPARLLERGYTLTFDASGRLLRAAGGLQTGDRLRTRFADGHVDSTVIAAGAPRPRRKGVPGGGEEDPGQQALF